MNHDPEASVHGIGNPQFIWSPRVLVGARQMDHLLRTLVVDATSAANLRMEPYEFFFI
jgi:hypothetical protein